MFYSKCFIPDTMDCIVFHIKTSGAYSQSVVYVQQLPSNSCLLISLGNSPNALHIVPHLKLISHLCILGIQIATQTLFRNIPNEFISLFLLHIPLVGFYWLHPWIWLYDKVIFGRTSHKPVIHRFALPFFSCSFGGFYILLLYLKEQIKK